MLHMVGETIRLVRSENGASIKDLADAVSVSPLAIQQYEDNIWRPGDSILKKIADYFGISVTEIENGYSVMFDQTTNELLVVRHISENQIRVVRRTKAGA